MTTFLPRLKAIEPFRWRTGIEKLFRRINSFALIRTPAYGNNAIIPWARGSLITYCSSFPPPVSPRYTAWSTIDDIEQFLKA